jgi:hypothetical protein
MTGKKTFLAAVAMLSAAVSAMAAEPKSFNTADDALWYYDAKKGCQEIQNSELTKTEINKFYAQSRDRILKGVKSGYSTEDYKAIEIFFHKTLPQWNKESPLVLYPCHAEEAKIAGKEIWVLAFNWEIPGNSARKNYITLSHIMLFIVDPASGAILTTSSCG